MADLSGFDANQVEPNSGYDPVPAGKYLAVVTTSEMKETKAGTGKYLELRLQILEGEYAGRIVWSRLNLFNPNATAVQIAQADLSAICRAVEVLQPNDSVDLHNLPLVIDVRVKKRPDTSELVNEIKGYAKKDTPPPASAAMVGDNTPPWKRS